MSDAVPSSPPRGAWRRLGLLLVWLVVLALLVVLTELALRATGLGDPRRRVALRAGLNDYARYLAPDELVPGGWRTQMFGDAGLESHIPPRDGRMRVLLLGGASMSALPDEHLAAALDAADPGRGHEVVNLGKPGYGSERVAILLRQALPALQPDVVVVYCGHGEFIEPGLGAALLEGARPLGLEDYHLANVVAGVLGKDPDRVAWAAGPEPEAPRAWPAPSPLTTQAAAARVYEAYRFHLTDMARAARAEDVRLVLATVTSNMLFYPALSAHDHPLTQPEQAEFDQARSRAYELLPDRLVRGLLRTGPDEPPLAPGWLLWGEHLALQVPPPWPPRSQFKVPPPLRTLGAPFDGGPLWPWPENWDPKLHEFFAVLQAFHERQLTAEERAAVEECVAGLERAVALSPEHAHATFELGLCLTLLGDDARGAALLRRAHALDVRPNRGNDVINRIVREVAAEQGAALCDVDALAVQASPGGLVGFELIMDSSTLQPGARTVVAEALVPAILGR